MFIEDNKLDDNEVDDKVDVEEKLKVLEELFEVVFELEDDEYVLFEVV